ncbi:MAG TPA: Flp family type IVb pilin [Actinomycetota bacterium]|jgi:Flp pilus assembly pilin Flp|nr:Flp family type IVb pilin [Actinomycetota bacterium]
MREPRWRERGVTSVEYALMATIIALLLIGGVVALFDAVQDRFERDADCAEQAYESSVEC